MVALQRCYSDVAMMLRWGLWWCYNDGTVMLQRYNSDVKEMLKRCCGDVTMMSTEMLHWCCGEVYGLWCYSEVTIMA